MDVVNGYICRNCTDVAYAQRNIDPQHPKDGPFGVNKAEDRGHGPAVVLDGKLAPAGPASSVNGVAAVDPVGSSEVTAPIGPRRVDISV